MDENSQKITFLKRCHAIANETSVHGPKHFVNLAHKANSEGNFGVTYMYYSSYFLFNYEKTQIYHHNEP